MITTITLTYDGGGHRVMKKVGTVETWYLADGGEGGRSGQLRFIDLFCGIGGFRLAFERAGARCVFSSTTTNRRRSCWRT